MHESHYTVLKDLYLGTPRSVNNSARLTIAPTKATDRELSRYGVVSGNVTDMGDGKSNADAHLAGAGLVCYDDNVWQTDKGCMDKGAAALGDLHEPAQTRFPAPAVPKPPGDY